MKLRQLLRASALLMLCFLVFDQVVSAADESYIQTLSGNIRKKDTCTVVDDKFANLSLAEWNTIRNLSVDNIITFEIRQDTSIFYYKKPFTCTLTLTIQYYTSRDQLQPTELTDVKMVVQYDTATGKVYPVFANYQFKNAFKVKVIVNSITSPEYGTQLPAIFRIRNQILVTRKYPFNTQATGSLSFSTGQGAAEGLANKLVLQPGSGKLTAGWGQNDFPNAEEFDFEWTYIDSKSDKAAIIAASLSGGIYNIPDATVAGWMANDNSRVTVASGTFNHTLSLGYQDGYILTRVRGVSYNQDNIRVTTNWIYTMDGAPQSTACIQIVAHEPTLNWQFVRAFAEEGKHKDVITYFDGSLRNRQAVTINSTDNIAIAAETIYDNMGRPFVNVLPAPLTSSVLKYYNGISRNDAGSPYRYTDVTGALSCALTAADMSSANEGASQYYSSSNYWSQLPVNAGYYFEKYVPDAGKKPFTVTEYTADNTGRIRRQGGVGPAFQLNGGHETKYFYGKPTQTELDRLFGMEVGNSSHYLKNTVIDPNGQASVSYIDANGKTIATALAGLAPANVDELSSATQPQSMRHYNEEIIKAEDMQADASALKMTAAATFLVTYRGPHQINYSVNPSALVTNHGAGNALQFCNTCSYEVLIEVKDACGQTQGTPLTTTAFQLNTVSCSPTSAVTGTLNLPILEVGEYNVSYTLRLSEETIRFHTDYYIANNSSLKQLQTFFEDELVQADLKGCYNECTTCAVKLGSQGEFTTKMQALLLNLRTSKYADYPSFDITSTAVQNWISSTYWELYYNCQAISSNCIPSPCEQKLEMMKRDVLPGGQYALYTATPQASPLPDTYAYTERSISILRFYNDPSSPETYNLWYIDEDGTFRYVRDLSESDFIKEYQRHPEWADAFVKKHIEYCSYLWCKDSSYSNPAFKNENSYIFDEKLRQITRGSDAAALGYYSRSNLTALLDLDPFFNGGRGNASYKALMANDLSKLSDVLHMTLQDQYNQPLASKNIIQLIDWMLYCRPTNPNATTTDMVNSWSCFPSASCMSTTREWEMYRQFYLQLKSKYMEVIKQAAVPSCTNCFIGKDPLMATGAVSGESNAVTNTQSPCPTYYDFTTVTDNYQDYYDYSYPYYSYSNTYDVYFVHNGGPVSRNTTIVVTSTVQSCNYCSQQTYTYSVTIPAGSDRVYLGQYNYSYTYDYNYGDYSNYYYQDYFVHETPITCAEPSSCVTINSSVANKELMLASNWPTSPVACNHSDEFDAMRWTNGGTWLVLRSYLEFDLSSIPSNATITSASLSLFAHLNPSNGNFVQAMYGANSSYLQRVTTPWSCGTSWNGRPSTTSSNQVTLAQSTSSFQDYTNINVKNLVQDMVSYGNYGFALQQTNESAQTYHSMAFYGPAAANPAKRPVLNICYTAPLPNITLVSSSCTGNANYAQYQNKVRVFNDYVNLQGYLNQMYQNPSSTTEAAAIAAIRTEATNNLAALKDNWLDRLRGVVKEEGDKDRSNNVPVRFLALEDPNATTINSTLINLADKLAEVSQAWINIAPKDNIRPASTLPNAGTDAGVSTTVYSASGYNSFEAVFNALVPGYVNIGFGAHLLDIPAPWNRTIPVANETVGEITPALASTVNTWYSQSGATNYLQFHSYLQGQLGTDYILTLNELTDLMTRISNNCRVLNEPLQLPVAFSSSPSADHPKASCSRMATLISGFNSMYYGVAQDSKLYRVLLQNYLNSKLGFGLNYDDYANFLNVVCPSNPLAVLYNKALVPLVSYDDMVCVNDVLAGVFERAGQEYVRYIEIERRKFRNAYISKCLSTSATAKVEGDEYEYHYTLYYYDQSGSLVKTIPPEGVTFLTPQELALVKEHRNDDPEACNGIGVPWYEDQYGTLSSLSNNLDYNAAHGIEMWLYNNTGQNNRQVRFITPDQKYLYQAAIANNKLWVETYAIQASGGSFTITETNKAVADISSIAVQPWSHLFVQTSQSIIGGNRAKNTSLYLNGNYSYGNNIESVPNNFTVEFWVKPNTTHQIDGQSASGTAGTAGQKYAFMPVHGGTAASGKAGMGISVGTNGVSVYEHADSYLAPLLVWSGSLSGWTHVAVVYSGKQPSLYINGSWVKTGLTSSKTYVYPGTQLLGGTYGYLSGQMDEARIWNYSRNASQIQSTMNKALVGNESGLVSYWPFSQDDGGTVLLDKTSAGRHYYLPYPYGWYDWTDDAVVLTNNAPPPAIGQLQLYLDGVKLTNLPSTGAPAYPFALQSNGVGGYYIPSDQTGILKHLRIYNREASDAEELANARNLCLSPVGALASSTNPLLYWGRFNVPQPGAPTTIDDYSTVEAAKYFIVPAHRLPTNYAYNSLNQVIKQSSPDGGTSEFFYDRLGRLAVSQNEEQKTPAVVNAENPAGRYSYTRYDALGRIVEVGEKLGAATMTEEAARSFYDLPAWMNSGSNRQVTVTAYDAAPGWAPAGVGVQQNLRKRVSATALLATAGNPAVPSLNRVAASYYSYDESGNVKRLIQENTAQAAREGQAINGATGLKELKYEYDLVSGKVNKVLYQDGKWDQFYYAYKYDFDNQLVDAYTSRINYPSSQLTNWIRESHSRYYLHGFIARTELGKNSVQGIDYTYTLQGWLKGVNSYALDPSKDMSGDGYGASGFSMVGRDALAFTLSYYIGDYAPVSGGNAFSQVYNNGEPPAPVYGSARSLATGKSLYNGNIARATYAISNIESGHEAGYSYRYDQLNRLTAMRRHDLSGVPSTWNNGSILSSGAYAENISYDANGNILTYQRNGAASQVAMDNLTYGYNKDAENWLVNNRLRHVKDAVSSTYTEDLENQVDDNYTYDKIGNLIADQDNTSGNKINSINWTMYGKIASIQKNNGTTISYAYDAGGNRVSKKVDPGSSQPISTTYYVRDAQGNVIGVYTDKSTGNEAGYSWSEQHIYGSSRLGMLTPQLLVSTGQTLSNDSYTSIGDPAANGLEGVRRYELANHLGNVLITISDKLIAQQAGNTTYYVADILTAQDYSPFGVQMPTRKYQALGTYRYGFNGKENDNEVRGEGGQQDYGMRIYDPRIGKFLSVDPIGKDFPWNSPYSYAEGDPINFIDLDGLEKPVTRAQTVTGVATAPVLTTTTSTVVEKSTEMAVNQGGKLVVKRSTGSWLGTVLTKGGGLLISFLLSPLEAGHGCACGAGHDLHWQCPKSPTYREPKIIVQPQPQPEPEPIDPRTVRPPRKDDEDGAHLYKTLDNQKNTGNGGLGIVANKMDDPIPYIGITTDKIIGSRYSSLSIRGANSEILATDKYTTIAGAETAIIALNTYGLNYKKHLTNLVNADARNSTRIANLTFTHKNMIRIRAGINLLNKIKPGWDKENNPNSLLFPENKKGTNNANP